MNPDDLAKILDDLSRRLGPAGQHVFDLAVRQVIIDSVIGIVFGVLFIVVFLIVARIDIAQAREHGDLFDAPLGFPLMMVTIFASIAALGSLYLIGMDLSRLFNPEYSAIRDILGALPK